MEIIKSGENLQLTSGNKGVLKRVAIGIGWRATAVKFNEESFDLDVSLGLLNDFGKIREAEDLVSYRSKLALNGLISHSGDETEGADDDDDDDQEVITIRDLSAIPTRIARLNAAVSVHRAKQNGYHFGMVKNAYLRILDMEKNRTLVRYDLTGDFSNETCVQVGSIERELSGWTFKAIGESIDGGFGGMITQYGGIATGRAA